MNIDLTGWISKEHPFHKDLKQLSIIIYIFPIIIWIERRFTLIMNFNDDIKNEKEIFISIKKNLKSNRKIFEKRD